MEKEAGKKCSKIQTELDDVLQEQETDRNSIEFERRRLREYAEKVRQKEGEIQRHSRQAETLAERIESQNNVIEDETRSLVHLENLVSIYRSSSLRNWNKSGGF